MYLQKSYESIFGLPVGMKSINSKLNIGPISVLVENKNKIYPARLNKNGVISGLVELYRDLDLKFGMTIYYENHATDAIKIYFPKKTLKNKVAHNPSTRNNPSRKLKWAHNEIYDDNNFNRWTPNSKLDVCFVFGLLHDFTDFQYCGALTQDMMSKIEYLKNYPNATDKPDAIVFHKNTACYSIAKFECKSSEYKNHHAPNDVDVLIVWRNDETDRSLLPMHVIELYQLAKHVAMTHTA